jgi:hypothetical protein
VRGGVGSNDVNARVSSENVGGAYPSVRHARVCVRVKDELGPFHWTDGRYRRCKGLDMVRASPPPLTCVSARMVVAQGSGS